MIRRVRKRLAHALDRRFLALHQRVDHLTARVEDLAQAAAERDDRLETRLDEQLRTGLDKLAGVERRLAAGDDRSGQLLEAVHAQVDEISFALQLMAGNDGENRRLLDVARLEPDYDLAFEEPEPLVSVIVPTRDRIELLTSRALPSILGQTHARLEVIVVGDAVDEETEAAVRAVEDPRLTFVNLTQRYAHPDSQRHWFAAGTLARNEGYRLAGGRWLVDADDDDELRDDAIQSLLAMARSKRLEVVQGIMRRHAPDGSATHHVGTPMQLSLSGAVVHAHLRFFGREHVASAFRVGGDVFRGERMVRAGVRIGLLDQVTYEYYPATLWESP
jgi:Glycosyl transferase family 2